uniref:Uncharacterized protein n=1 Tax=Calcidiscus leptoporus TaxID=127549 RepID=A0A7S0JBU8_9EUKA|mmetsp:Transcript_49991/g.115364  ORF Transcript_49991/g.115364 Transcript_49991/m.115364 type:complete len:187 (+) Transcript_49991:2-562(+)
MTQAQAALSTKWHAGLEKILVCKSYTYGTKRLCLGFSTRVQIIKNPVLALTERFPIWLTPPVAALSNVIVPVRHSTETSASRAQNNFTNGGFWHGARTALEQQRLDEHILSTLVVELTRQGVPTTLLAYPRHVLDAEYCADELYFLRARYGVSRSAFVAAHRALSNASLVHSALPLSPTSKPLPPP